MFHICSVSPAKPNGSAELMGEGNFQRRLVSQPRNIYTNCRKTHAAYRYSMYAVGLLPFGILYLWQRTWRDMAAAGSSGSVSHASQEAA